MACLGLRILLHDTAIQQSDDPLFQESSQTLTGVAYYHCVTLSRILAALAGAQASLKGSEQVILASFVHHFVI